MLVVMKMGASGEEIEDVVRQIESRGLKANPIPGLSVPPSALPATSALWRRVCSSLWSAFSRSSRSVTPTSWYRESSRADTVVEVGDVKIGGSDLVDHRRAVLGGEL